MLGSQMFSLCPKLVTSRTLHQFIFLSYLDLMMLNLIATVYDNHNIIDVEQNYLGSHLNKALNSKTGVNSIKLLQV